MSKDLKLQILLATLMFVKPDLDAILAQVPGDALANLRRVDRLWQNLGRSDSIPTVIHHSPEHLGELDQDVVICGGTLGVFLAATLARRGWRVTLLERGILRGRDQEWNTSRSELATLLELEVLSAAELEQAIASEFNPVRLSFGGEVFWLRDVLNIGVDPVFLLNRLKHRFLEAGGQLLEHTVFETATIHPNGIAIQAGGTTLTARLLLDGMGHFSPIVAQARAGQCPESVCLVVGTCAGGIPENTTADLMVSFTPIQQQHQYFWEAFPARGGRTTYLFTYTDPQADRLSLEALFTDYLRLLPDYQSISLEQLQIHRALFGFFPAYRRSPLKTPWDRILPIGDSSSNQSPLSFGGFGAMLRHLSRLDGGIDQALNSDVLTASDLALLQPYQPNLSVTWLFQRAMSVRSNQNLDPEQINRLLRVVFATMAQLGDRVMQPFLRDVIQFSGLSQTLLQVAIRHPLLVGQIIPQVGVPTLLDWCIHYANLGIYSGLADLALLFAPWTGFLTDKQRYYGRRWLESWKYGSGKE